MFPVFKRIPKWWKKKSQGSKADFVMVCVFSTFALITIFAVAFPVATAAMLVIAMGTISICLFAGLVRMMFRDFFDDDDYYY